MGDAVRTIRFTSTGKTLHINADVKLTFDEKKAALAIASRVFRLHDDFSPFYEMIANDPQLAWAIGSGRLPASPTVFEDVIKTICTTNCAWSATERMVTALVKLGGGAFPDPLLLAKTPERWYADVARMGYRGPYVRSIARDVTNGKLDLEKHLPGEQRDAEAVEAQLLELPGVGPYAAAHIMQLLGYHHRLVLDSATRPRFLALAKKKRAADKTIIKTFRKYGDYAGLAFWLFVTRDWLGVL